MISNREFMQRQSYEISWAVFRCAELFSQSTLREKVEAAAVDLTASCGSAIDASGTNFPHIEKLVALIRLAESVGQIAPVNANVLYRELDNLSKAARVSIAEQRGKENITESLERIFTNSAYAKSLSADIQNVNPTTSSSHSVGSGQAPAGAQRSPKRDADSAIRQDTNGKFGDIQSLLSAVTAPVQPISVPHYSGNDSAMRDSNDSAISLYAKQPISADIQQSSASPISAAASLSAFSANALAQTGSWQYVILQKVKDLGQTTTKELTASFPEISERTIRFYLQKLVDSGAISRIGSTGPGAAYKAK